MEAALSVVFGLIVGSFLNVVIHRLPRGESIVFPRRIARIAGSRSPSMTTSPC